MKIFNIIFSVIALGIIVFNATQLNFNNLFEGNSLVALISIFALLCAILLIQILSVSQKIQRKVKL